MNCLNYLNTTWFNISQFLSYCCLRDYSTFLNFDTIPFGLLRETGCIPKFPFPKEHNYETVIYKLNRFLYQAHCCCIYRSRIVKSLMKTDVTTFRENTCVAGATLSRFGYRTSKKCFHVGVPK
jgi:hypothetical protein